jgi:hypothetical protein
MGMHALPSPKIIANLALLGWGLIVRRGQLPGEH